MRLDDPVVVAESADSEARAGAHSTVRRDGHLNRRVLVVAADTVGTQGGGSGECGGYGMEHPCPRVLTPRRRTGVGDVHAGEDRRPLPSPYSTLDEDVTPSVLEHLLPGDDTVQRAQQPRDPGLVHRSTMSARGGSLRRARPACGHERGERTLSGTWCRKRSRPVHWGGDTRRPGTGPRADADARQRPGVVGVVAQPGRRAGGSSPWRCRRVRRPGGRARPGRYRRSAVGAAGRSPGGRGDARGDAAPRAPRGGLCRGADGEVARVHPRQVRAGS